MSSEKRRRARIQGGWAAPRQKCQQNVRSDDHKPQNSSSVCPAWLGKNVDTPPPKQYVYEKPEEEIKEKPPERVIDKAGVYDISISVEGVSRVRVFPNFIDAAECEWIYDQLFHEIPWQHRSDVRKGVSYTQPRLTAWFGDLPYSYSGLTWDPNPKWSPLTVRLKERLEQNTGYQFNSMLANLYRDGHDSIDWHADDEPSLGPQPIIASLTFGDTRTFELRQNPPPEKRGDYSMMEHIKVPLEAGTLLIMEGALQNDWQHRIPKEYHDRGPRINLTYRVSYPV